MRGSAADVVPLLARRESLLSALWEGPQAKCDLVRTLDISRSTVDRSIRELETKGLVERREGGFGLTLPGRLLFEEYREFRERSDGISSADDLLSVLSPDTRLDAGMLAGAEIVVADRTTPYRPADRFLDRVCDADSAKILSTAIGPQYVDVIREQVVEEGLEYSVGATTTVIERFVSEHDRAMRESLATDRMALRELSDDPPFSVVVLDSPSGRSAGVLVYGNEGARGYIDNDSPDAVEWAEAYFRRYWRDATPIGAPSTES